MQISSVMTSFGVQLKNGKIARFNIARGPGTTGFMRTFQKFQVQDYSQCKCLMDLYEK